MKSALKRWRSDLISGGDLAPSLEGRTFFRGPIHFHGQNFWWLFFSHWPGFSDFPFLFPDFPYLFLLCSMSYMTPSSQEQPLFQKRIPLGHYDTFFYSVRTFARIRQHYFSKYWGVGCMGRPHTSIFWGTVPQEIPRSPPLDLIVYGDFGLAS